MILTFLEGVAMRSLGLLVFGLSLATGTAAGVEVSHLLPGEGDSPACWQRVYSQAHLAARPDQQVTAMTFGAGFYPHEETTAAEAGLTLFGMDVALRDGTRGHTSGVCWQDEAGALRCGVECDGGGVMVGGARDGGLLLDLQSTGYIRMEGECGSDGDRDSFELEAGADDRQFLLLPVDAKACRSLMPD